MEKKNRPYSIVQYDPQWVESFAKEKQNINEVFGNLALTIEHVGSTSVEGMWAKPQIDIQVTVDDLNDINKLIPVMEGRGYIYQPEFETFNERYFTRDDSFGQRLVSIHVMDKSDPKAMDRISFREYLKTHPEDRDLYSKTKRDAYEAGVDRAEYPKRKHAVLDMILDRARKWARER